MPRFDADSLLTALVEMVNSGGYKDREKSWIGLTLLVDGFLVSGKMVSGQRYLDGVAEQFTRVDTIADRSATDAFVKFFRDFGAHCESGAQPASQTPYAGYIHLEHARFFHPGGQPLPHEFEDWWRGRLSAVSGFMFGILEEDGEWC